MYNESRSSHNWLVMKAANDKVRLRLPQLAGTVLDLGCGTRPFEHDILQFADEYVGVDWGNTLHGLQADIAADLNGPLPVASASVDHVVCFEVMEHLREPQVMLEEAYRVLRGGGGMTVSVPFQWWIHEAPWDYYRYTCFGLQYLFEKAGFVDIDIQPTTGFWTMWTLKLNYQFSRLLKGPRWARLPARLLLTPFWWLNQHAACWLDSWWPEDYETVGYFVTARKP